MIDKVLGGKYRIRRLLGKGGMGAVYEAEVAGTDRLVAVKVIHSELAKREAIITRFHREIRAVAALGTPHIVDVIEAGTHSPSGEPYMVMELLDGEDLQQILARLGPLPPDLALRIAAQACIGLARAHEERVVHRDVKPANLFLAKTGDGKRVLKLLDFGIAKIKMEDQSYVETTGLTRAGSMLGSPHYMSPEQARGVKALDQRADLWSLGVVLYQALCGQAPHKDIDALGELIIAICSMPPPPLQDVAPWVPPEVARVTHGAMRFDPAHRYQTAGEMLDAIKPLLDEGWDITEEMLRPLMGSERGQVAKRYVDTRPDTPRLEERGGHDAEAGAPPAAPAPPSELARPGADGVATSRTGAPAPAGAGVGRASIVGGAIALVLAAGAAAYGLSRASAPAAPAPIPVAAPEPTLAAPVTASAPAEPAPVVDARPRWVKLVVIPAGASVEIDGAAARAKDGVVELHGPLGSVHRVRLKVGDAEATQEVVITETGALPPKVELPKAPRL